MLRIYHYFYLRFPHPIWTIALHCTRVLSTLRIMHFGVSIVIYVLTDDAHHVAESDILGTVSIISQ
jgi:hypothetical protein